MKVGHDVALECGSIDEFVGRLEGLAGTVETGAMYGWKVAQKRLPQAKLVVVHRPVEEVHSSFARLGVPVPLQELVEKRAMLEELGRQPGVATFDFTSFPDYDLLQRLYGHCHGEPCDLARLNGLLYRNIQIDMAERIRYIIANHARIEGFKAEVLREVAAYG
jgi:hypothetical protein